MPRRAETRAFRTGTRWEHEIKRRARSVSTGRVRAKSFFPGVDSPSGTPIITTLSVRTSGWVREIRDGATAHHLRTRLFLFMYDPAGSKGAYIYMLATCALSVLHVVVWCMQESHLHMDYEGRSGRAALHFAVFLLFTCLFLLFFFAILAASCFLYPSSSSLRLPLCPPSLLIEKMLVLDVHGTPEAETRLGLSAKIRSSRGCCLLLARPNGFSVA